jgi:microcystin-dependent protein
MSKLNINLSGTQITDEVINRASSTAARLAHDTILDDGSLTIRTAAAGGGTLLVETTDYVLGDLNSRLTGLAGDDVFLTVAIVNATYQNVNLYVTYKTVGDIAEAEDINAAAPTGMIAPFAMSTAPTGWLSCDGAAISRATYARLFAAIGTTWGVGDGSTTFNKPDFRGRFLRGQDAGANRDPDRATRTASASGGATGDNVGSVQNDVYKEHAHSVVRRMNGVAETVALVTNGDNYGSCTTDRAFVSISVQKNGFHHGSSCGFVNDIITGLAGSSETRPVNAGVNYCIKF